MSDVQDDKAYEQPADDYTTSGQREEVTYSSQVSPETYSAPTEAQNETHPEHSNVETSNAGNQGFKEHGPSASYEDMLAKIDSDPNNPNRLEIIETSERGGTFSKYTVYLIAGQDVKGEVSVSRRFNQFHEMRLAMVKRWPGCFIPSIPGKSINKNDKDIITRRKRYLNDFLKKMTRLPHLYFSEEFQTFLRSKEPDISAAFSHWPTPSNEDIILKYKESFSQLAGKQINAQTMAKISEFTIMIRRNEQFLLQCREMAKRLAMARDDFDKSMRTHYT